MKRLTQKAKWLLPLAILGISAITILASSYDINKSAPSRKVAKCCNNPNPNHVCVMKTILGIDSSEDGKLVSSFINSPMVDSAVKRGIDWIAAAQAPDGGWGSGSHSAQDIRDPHAVSTDPASTSLVSMSLLRNDYSLEKGKYAQALKKGTEYLLRAVENCPANQVQITKLTNTQPQVKLGKNIDVILTAQFFTNILRYEIKDEQLKKRIEKALDKCIDKIQK